MGTLLAILVVDGHASVREALVSRLSQLAGVGAVQAAGTIDAASEIARHLRPDLVLYDPRTVAGDAAEGVRRLCPTGGAVVVLTSSLGREEAIGVWAAGAAAVLLKGSGTVELEAAIAVARAQTSGEPASDSGRL